MVPCSVLAVEVESEGTFIKIAETSDRRSPLDSRNATFSFSGASRMVGSWRNFCACSRRIGSDVDDDFTSSSIGSEAAVSDDSTEDSVELCSVGDGRDFEDGCEEVEIGVEGELSSICSRSSFCGIDCCCLRGCAPISSEDPAMPEYIFSAEGVGR